MMKRFSSIVLAFALALSSCTKPGDEGVIEAGDAMRTRDFDRAERLLLRALDEETSYSKELLYSLLANVAMLQGENAKAADWLEKAVAIAPDYRLLVTLAANYTSVGDEVRAEDALARAFAVDEGRAEAHAQLGAMRVGQGRFEEAVPLLEKAAATEPNIAVVHANLAVAYARLGRAEESEAEFAKAERLKCENLAAFRERANPRAESAGGADVPEGRP